MQNLIAIASLVVQLIPLLIQAVNAIEAQFPQSGYGAAKLELVKSTLQAAFQGLGDLKVTFDQTWPALSALISGIVTLNNKLGIFKNAA